MATNPMKRREHTALIIGFVIGLALTVVVGAIGYKKYSDKKKELTALKAKQSTVIVAARDIESGVSLSEEDFTSQVVMTTMSPEDTFTSTYDILGNPIEWVGDGSKDDEDEEDEDDIEKDDEEEKVEYDAAAKVAIPAGTIITKSLITSKENALTNDKRLNEYSCIAIPSELRSGEFVDIRYSLPSGQDYIVLSKKEIVQSNQTTIWINVNEAEMLLMNSAIVEAWTITGSRLYAIEYVDAGMQDAALVTYKPSAEVIELLNKDKNITREAMNSLSSDLYNLGKTESGNEFRTYIDSALTQYIEERDEIVKAGNDKENATMQQHRADYIKALSQ